MKIVFAQAPTAARSEAGSISTDRAETPESIELDCRSRELAQQRERIENDVAAEVQARNDELARLRDNARRD